MEAEHGGRRGKREGGGAHVVILTNNNYSDCSNRTNSCGANASTSNTNSL